VYRDSICFSRLTPPLRPLEVRNRPRCRFRTIAKRRPSQALLTVPGPAIFEDQNAGMLDPGQK
jgi:hypothetical protein